MHVDTKKMAMAGLCVAFSVVMMTLSSFIESSSLFFIAAASFCVGIAVREWGLKQGVAFYVASVILNFLLAPSKLYCFTLAGMGCYIWLSEWLWRRIADAKTCKHRVAILWIGKYIIFNLLYVPTLFFAPQVLFTGKMNGPGVAVLLVLGQAVLYLYDLAYRYVQSQIWGKLRVKFIKK